MPTDSDAKFVTEFCFLQYLAKEERNIHYIGRIFKCDNDGDVVLEAFKRSVVRPWTREVRSKLNKLADRDSSSGAITQQTINNNITNNIVGSGKANIKCTTTADSSSNISSGSGLSPSKWQEVWRGLKIFFGVLASILHLQ